MEGEQVLNVPEVSDAELIAFIMWRGYGAEAAGSIVGGSLRAMVEADYERYKAQGSYPPLPSPSPETPQSIPTESDNKSSVDAVANAGAASVAPPVAPPPPPEAEHGDVIAEAVNYCTCNAATLPHLHTSNGVEENK